MVPPFCVEDWYEDCGEDCVKCVVVMTVLGVAVVADVMEVVPPDVWKLMFLLFSV